MVVMHPLLLIFGLCIIKQFIIMSLRFPVSVFECIWEMQIFHG